MKNALLSFFLFIITIGCSNAQTLPSGLKSLNRITQTDAVTMINAYQTYIANNKFYPKQQSVWFDRDTFNQMIHLLDADRDHPTDLKHPTDGVRIYFGLSGDPNSSFVFQIILLPTHYLQDDAADITGQDHGDYYLDGNDSIFYLKNITGKTKVRGFIRAGERLYKHCTNCTVGQNCNVAKPHYIERDSAENWVAKFGLRPMITKSEWFDLGLLDALNAETLHDGIRIYFAKHPLGAPPINKQPVSDKDAFIFELTQSHGIPGIGSHEDYFPCLKMDDLSINKSKRSHLIFTGGDNNPGGQDNGSLCPNNCTH